MIIFFIINKMIKAFLILVLVCTITSSDVPEKTENEGLNWEEFWCLITSEQLIKSAKIIINLAKKSEWNRILEYFNVYFSDIKDALEVCFPSDTVLTKPKSIYKKCVRGICEEYNKFSK